MIAELREFFVEGGDCGVPLFQQVVDQCLFALVELLLLREELLKRVSRQPSRKPDRVHSGIVSGVKGIRTCIPPAGLGSRKSPPSAKSSFTSSFSVPNSA